MSAQFPKSQGELIKRVRGKRAQLEFAKVLGVERSCLSRYESEKLGAPTKVLNYCLSAIAAQPGQSGTADHPVDQALAHARQAVDLLERAKEAQQQERAQAGGKEQE
jgi:DNA-binding XRE family transcriptional regulator